MRRLKTEVLKDLPEKKCDISLCEMTKRQREEYDILVSNCKELKSAFLNKNAITKSSDPGKTKKVGYMSVLSAIAELRVS
jgi:SNF2 family DNA or RNA helicase